ncbi:MAG TPA: hypothetical protein VFC00_33920 [Micromonosporaceae bacterium]|nr:hypothetical protein [Micromonosporaceae bacterium]
MPDPQETFVDTQAALDGASRLTEISSEFSGAWSGIKGRIEDLHAEAPWGTDEVGTEFASKYMPGGEEAGATGVVTGTDNLSQTLGQVGPSITDAVNGTVQTDTETGDSLRPQ